MLVHGYLGSQPGRGGNTVPNGDSLSLATTNTRIQTEYGVAWGGGQTNGPGFAMASQHGGQGFGITGNDNSYHQTVLAEFHTPPTVVMGIVASLNNNNSQTGAIAIRATTFELRWGAPANGASASPYATTIAQPNTRYLAIGRLSAGGFSVAASRQIWVDGHNDTSAHDDPGTTSANIVIINHTGRYCHLNRSATNAAAGAGCWIYHAALWRRALSDAEMLSVFENPFQIYKPISPISYFWLGQTAPGGGGETVLAADATSLTLSGAVAELLAGRTLIAEASSLGIGALDAALVITKFARPSSTVSAGSWSAVPSGTLHGVSSDQSDATWMSGPVGATCELGFPAMATPDAGEVIFTVRFKNAGGPE